MAKRVRSPLVQRRIDRHLNALKHETVQAALNRVAELHQALTTRGDELLEHPELVSRESMLPIMESWRQLHQELSRIKATGLATAEVEQRLGIAAMMVALGNELLEPEKEAL